MAKKHYASDRRHMEMKDAGMLNEDHSQIANMPQGVKYQAWPKPAYGALDSGMDDTISGVNDQMSKDESKGRAGMKPHKY